LISGTHKYDVNEDLKNTHTLSLLLLVVGNSSTIIQKKKKTLENETLCGREAPEMPAVQPSPDGSRNLSEAI
jgi:hypothetical protein